MLKEIREKLENLGIVKEEIERAENILAKYNKANREFAQCKVVYQSNLK